LFFVSDKFIIKTLNYLLSLIAAPYPPPPPPYEPLPPPAGSTTTTYVTGIPRPGGSTTIVTGPTYGEILT